MISRVRRIIADGLAALHFGRGLTAFFNGRNVSAEKEFACAHTLTGTSNNQNLSVLSCAYLARSIARQGKIAPSIPLFVRAHSYYTDMVSQESDAQQRAQFLEFLEEYAAVLARTGNPTNMAVIREEICAHERRWRAELRSGT